LPRREGQFLVEDFYLNEGGLNTADSPFIVQPSEATGGQNFDLQIPGAIRKRGGHLQLNSAANTQLKSLGLGLWNKPDTTRQPMRAAGTKWQAFDPSAHTFTNLYEDTAKTSMGTATITIASPGVVTFTAHGLDVTDPVQFTTTGALPTGLTASTTYYVKTVLTADTFTLAATVGGTVITTTGTQSGTHTLHKFTTAFLTGGSTQPVVFSMYNTPSTGVLWAAGGGMASLYGAYSATKVTANGTSAPTTSSFTATPAAGGSLTAGTYRYTLVYRKLSTQALSNALAATEASGTTSGGDLTLNLAWTLTNNDTTKYDKIYVYRSSVSGAEGFTAGTLVTILASSATTFADTGSTAFTGYAISQNVPRAASTVLDNSVLATATYRPLTTFKRRLVTASASSLYFSDLNKPESWPTYQTLSIPSGGEITALAVVALTSPLSTDIDEALVVFKQSECWVVTGDGILDDDSLPNWVLKFVNNSGAITQASVVTAEGYIAWVNYKGFYMWNGTGKPIRISRKIWDKFQQSGDIDKSKLGYAFGIYSQKRNEILWCLSSSTLGEQKYVLKLDLQRTIPRGQANAVGDQELDGVFTPDVLSAAMYAGMSFLEAASSTEESLYLGDGAGFISSAFASTGDDDGDTDITMSVYTPYHNCGTPTLAKRFHKLVLWVLDNGVYNVDVSFWANYRFAVSEGSTQTASANPNPAVGNGIWDSGLWDVMRWDAAPSTVRALVYNLSPSQNNTEGDCIRFLFSQTGNEETPIIYGYSLYYSDISTRK
jgi:hypothetical protein